MRNLVAGLVVLAACGGAGSPKTPSSQAVTPPRIERVASPAEGILANAYLLETSSGVIAIDASLRVSDAKALRARIDAIGKPLLAVLLTHGHPDHYNGAAIIAGDAPVVATREVDAVIRESDAAKEQQWKPLFGAEWPERRQFPTRTIGAGETVEYGGLVLRAHAVGPAESHADSYWTIDGLRVAFIGDLVFSGTHSYVSDGHTGPWLAALTALEQALPADVTLYPGHGGPGGLSLLADQRRYLEAYRAEIKRLSPRGAALDTAAKAQLAEAMNRFHPPEALGFLVGLGADAVAAELAGEVR